MRNHEILPDNVTLENEKKILSKRELEIIILVAAGFENNQIAKIFRVTLSTIKKQLEKIYEKLNAKNRANAVFIAKTHGLISANDYNTVLNSPEVLKFLTYCKKLNKSNVIKFI
ncbi:response regulator transcription factor [bacterium]|nr:response regulator transcription factor [bacterium]